MRDHEKSREAISNAANIELARAQLDADINLDSFWGTMQRSFNRLDVVNMEHSIAKINGDDSMHAPMAQRFASILEKHHRDANKDFTF